MFVVNKVVYTTDVCRIVIQRDFCVHEYTDATQVYRSCRPCGFRGLE